MRKIKSMADVERVRRRNNILLGLFMIFLLVGSSLGYSLMSADSDEDSVVSELGFDFVRDGGMWKLEVGGEVFGFMYLPSEVSDVEVNSGIQFEMYSGQPLYFVNPGEGVNEILGNLGGYVLRYQEACLRQDSGIRDLGLGISEDGDLTDCEGDLPVKDCDSNLIVFEALSPIRDDPAGPNETRVYSEGNCVFIVGDVLRGSDVFLYEVLDIR